MALFTLSWRLQVFMIGIGLRSADNTYQTKQYDIKAIAK